MAINAVTPVRVILSAGGLQTVVSQPRSGGGGSSFGPAFVLGGSTTNFTQGLYNSSLGRVLNGGGTQTTSQAPTSASAYQKQRAAALEAAAAKIDRGDTQGGRAEAQQLLARNPNDVGALHLIAHSYLAEHKYEQAERYYARASALAPSNARLRSDLAQLRTLQKSDEEVLVEARRKLASPAHRSEAVRLLLYLSDRSPDNAEVYLAMADGFAAARKPLQVMGALQEAVKLADEDQIDEVISRAADLVEKHPQVGLAHNILGRALQKAGRLQEAVRELGLALDTAPYNIAYAEDLAGAYVAQARAELDAGNADTALGRLQAAQSLDPSNSELSEGFARVAAARAELAILEGRYSAALSELSTAGAKAPDDTLFKEKVAALYVRVAAHYQSQGDDAQALSSYRKAYELDATSALARRKVGELSYERGLDALDRVDYNAAIDHLDRAYQTDRTNDDYRQDLARAYDLRGQLRVSLGQDDEALEDFKKGFALDPSNTSLNANLSVALTSAGTT